jgi:hypothetical protein
MFAIKRGPRPAAWGVGSLALLWIASETTGRAQLTDATAQGGAIVGMLADAEGQRVTTGQAVVFLCDGATGLPLASDGRGPFDVSETHPLEFSGYCHAVTDDAGAFRFDDVPPGVYRLVAQSWEGMAGMANAMPDDDGPEPSSTLLLHGVAENVEVKPGEVATAVCRRQGDGVLRLLTDPEEPHNFIVISSNPVVGDGVLGPVGWGADFVAGALGITRVEDPALVVVGLAEGARVHVGLLNYDNSVGTGGGEFVVDGEQARLPIYAGWSNGKFEPPQRLVALTEALEASDVDVEALTGIGSLSNDDYLSRIHAAWSRAAEEVDVPGFGRAPLIDVLAAEAYRHLRKHHATR